MLPGYKVQSIYGSPQHTLLMNTTTYFFNQADYGTTIPTFSATNAKKNTVMLDSWLSTGGACNGYLGVPKTEDNGVGNFVNSNVPQLLQNNAAQAGIPLTTQDGMMAGTVPSTITIGIGSEINVFGDGTANGNSFTVTNGAWSCLAGASGPIPASNKVLIAQITTDGTFHFELNIQIGTPTGGTETYVASNPGTGELTIPSLTQTLYPVPDKNLNLVVFLEGLYTGSGTMNKAQGSSGAQFPGITADQVTIELHNSVTGAVEYSMNNLNLSTSGTLTGTVPAVHNGSYYNYIRHRNSISISSASPVSFAGGTINYDFSTGVSQAFGSNMKNVGGIAVMYAGDVNQDCGIDSSDLIAVDNNNAAFASGYLVTDVNGDGAVDSSDMIIVDNNNASFVGCVLPF